MPEGTRKPGRVLLTADTVGGVWTYALELAAALGKSGAKVGLATMGAPLTQGQQQEASRLDNLTIFESSYKLEWMENPWPDVEAAGEWLLSLETAWRPDVVHLNGYCHAILPWHAPVLVVGHSCVLSWWRAVKKEEAPVGWDKYRRRVSAGLFAAHGVVAPTKTMLQALEDCYGPLPQGTVVPNGRRMAEHRVAKEPLVFSAGRIWDEAKNLAALERVAPHVSWPIRVAGSDDHPGGRKAKPTSGIKLLGVLAPDEIAGWLARAAIYALPARYEPFGLSVLEAGLAGCALVLGDIPSLRENWEGAALFVSPEDDAGLTKSINLLIEDHQLRQEYAKRARLQALKFTPERMAAGYLAIYHQLMGRACA